MHLVPSFRLYNSLNGLYSSKDGLTRMKMIKLAERAISEEDGGKINGHSEFDGDV